MSSLVSLRMADGNQALHDKAEILAVLCCLIETLFSLPEWILQDKPRPLVGGSDASEHCFQAASSDALQVLRILRSR